jgi:hypothetical protein
MRSRPPFASARRDFFVVEGQGLIGQAHDCSLSVFVFAAGGNEIPIRTNVLAKVRNGCATLSPAIATGFNFYQAGGHNIGCPP